MKDALMLLTISSAFSSLITEAIKKMCENKVKSATMLAAIVAVMVSTLVCCGYGILFNVVPTPKTVVNCICLVILSWLCATIGYDKVIKVIRDLGIGNGTIDKS